MDESLNRAAAESPDAIIQGSSSVRSGVAWNTAGQIVSRLAVMVIGLVLARVLTPDAFGLFSLANSVIFMGLAFTDLGVGQALVRQQHNVAAVASAAFYMNLLTVSAFAAGLIAISPWVADFYDQASLRSIMIVLAAGFLLRGAASVHEAFIRKQLKFRQLQLINLTAVGVNGVVAITMAAKGAGPYALAFGFLAASFVSASCIVVLSHMPLTRRLHLPQWRGLISFGGVLLMSSVIWTGVTQMDNLGVGKLLGPSALGFYAVAYNYGVMPGITIGGAVAQAMYSAFSRTQDDLMSMRQQFLKTCRTIALMSMPMGVVALFVARDLLVLFLGERWEPAAIPFQVFLVTFTVPMFICAAPVIYLALGRPIINLTFALGTAPVLAVAIVIGSRAGVLGVAIGVSLMMLAHNFGHAVVASKMLGIRAIDTFREVAPVAAASAAGGCVAGILFLALPDLAIRPYLAGIAVLPVFALALRRGYRSTWDDGISDVRSLFRGGAASAE